jgi:hypothetical protein
MDGHGATSAGAVTIVGLSPVLVRDGAQATGTATAQAIPIVGTAVTVITLDDLTGVLAIERALTATMVIERTVTATLVIERALTAILSVEGTT